MFKGLWDEAIGHASGNVAGWVFCIWSMAYLWRFLIQDDSICTIYLKRESACKEISFEEITSSVRIFFSADFNFKVTASEFFIV